MINQKLIEAGTNIVKEKLLAKGVETELITRNILLIKSFTKKETIRVLVRQGPKQKKPKSVPELVWKIRDNAKADYVAAVNFHATSAWLFSLIEFKNICQQYSNGIYRFRMVTEKQKKEPLRKSFIDDFEKFIL